MRNISPGSDFKDRVGSSLANDMASAKPHDSTGLSRHTISTLDTISPRTSDPLTPKIRSKSASWEMDLDGLSQGGEPWSPDFLRKDDPWQHQEQHQEPPESSGSPQRKTKNMNFFRNIVSAGDISSDPSESPKEPRSPLSSKTSWTPRDFDPISRMLPLPDPWTIFGGSMVSAPISPRTTISDPWSSQPNSPQISRYWSPEILVPDPWYYCEKRLKRASVRSSKVIFWIAALVISTSPIHWFDTNFVVQVVANRVFATASVLFCACLIYSKYASNADDQDVLEMSECMQRKYFASIRLFDGISRFYNSRIFWQEMVAKYTSARRSRPNKDEPVSGGIVFPKGCHVTHITSGGRFEVLGEIQDLAEVVSWLLLQNVKTYEEVMYPKTQLKKIHTETLEPRSRLIDKLKNGHRENSLDSRAHLHLGAHFALLSQLAYASLPRCHPDATRKGNLACKLFGDIEGCAEFLKYDRDVEVYYIGEESLQALKFENKNEIVIVVRGTVPEPLAKGTWLGPNINTNIDSQPAFHRRYGFTHGGFWQAARNLWIRTDMSLFLSEHRKNYKFPKRVYFVGHSLGACISMFLARFCRDDPNVSYPADRIQIHTFGCGPVFYSARTLRFHKEFCGDKDDDQLAIKRVHFKVQDWDPEKQCEPTKIHHERWMIENDIVPALSGGTLVSALYKFLFWAQYSNFFTASHPDEPNRIPGMGHGTMTYYDNIKKLISRATLDTQRVSVELRTSSSRLEDLVQEVKKKKSKMTKLHTM